MIPVWLFAAYLMVSFALSQQQAYRDRAVQLARQSSVIVDAVVDGLSARLQRHAGSIEATGSEAAPTQAAVSRLALEPALRMRLQTRDGRLVFDSREPAGEAGSTSRRLAPFELEALDTDGTAVSDVYLDNVAGAAVVDLSVPVLLDASLSYLAITVPTSIFGDALRANLPSGWIVGVADRSDVYLTRSERHDDVAGRPGLPDYIGKAVGVSGTFKSRNQFGDTLLAGYFRSPRSGWLFAANIELSVAEAPLRRSLLGVLALAAVALGASLLLAYVVGRSLTVETARLVGGAMALGERRPIEPLRTRLSEFALVGDALLKADRMLSERTGQLGAVLETAPVAVWFTYDPRGREVIRNRYAAELMGIPSDDRPHFGSLDQVIDTIALKDGKEVSRDDRPLTRAMRGDVTDNEEFSYILPSGGERNLLTSARPILDHKGAVVGAVQISIDITERKRHEEQRRLLTNELNHRVKNNMAVVQSLAQQTLRHATSLEDASSRLAGRLSALAGGHEILTASSWTAGRLGEVIERTVYAQARSEQIVTTGDDLVLSPETVMALSLVLHELSTNAVKYGALSNDSGTVSISWRLDLDTDVLSLQWTEAGGPVVDEPTSRGFGTRLMTRTVEAQGGAIRVGYAPSGLEVMLSVRLLSSNRP